MTAWAGGSTRAWRRIRARVLLRDGYACRLRLEGCTGAAPARGGHVHHTLGRAVSGDDERHLVAACASCNLKLGEPALDPAPAPRTAW